MRDDQVIQRAFSQNTLALRSVRLLVHDTIGGIVERLDGGDPMTKAMQDELVSAVTYQTNVCMDVVRWAYMTSGSAGLRNPSVLQRCFRDMCVGAQHIYVDPRCHDEMGKGLLEVSRDDHFSNAVNGANMTEPHIERFGPDVSIGSLIEAMDRDGVAMVEDAISPNCCRPSTRVRRADRGVGARHAEPHPDADRLHGPQDASDRRPPRQVEGLRRPPAAPAGRSTSPTTTSCRRASTTC